MNPSKSKHKQSSPEQPERRYDTETLRQSGHPDTQDSQEIETLRDSGNRDTHDTHETQTVPLLVRIETVPQAIEHSLTVSVRLGKDSDCAQMEFGVGFQQRIFEFCRALKAFEQTCGVKITKKELPAHFGAWYAAASLRSLWPAGVDFHEAQFDFLTTFEKTRTALGVNPLEEAIRRAEKFTPSGASKFEGRIRKLASVCYHLQQMTGKAPFFLGARGAAQAAGIVNLDYAWKMLTGLAHPSVDLIELVQMGNFSKHKGEDGKATRWRWKEHSN